MIPLGASQALEGSTTTASTVTCTVWGCLATDTAPTPKPTKYEILAQLQLATSAGSIYTPGASASALISAINLVNTSSSTAQTVKLYAKGTAAANQIAQMVIPASGFATYESGEGWTVYNATGVDTLSLTVATYTTSHGTSITSGTAFQPTANHRSLVTVVVKHSVAETNTVTITKGPSSGTTATVVYTAVEALDAVGATPFPVIVPAGWYVKVTLSSTTDTTATYTTQTF